MGEHGFAYSRPKWAWSLPALGVVITCASACSWCDKWLLWVGLVSLIGTGIKGINPPVLILGALILPHTINTRAGQNLVIQEPGTRNLKSSGTRIPEVQYKT